MDHQSIWHFSSDKHAIELFISAATKLEISKWGSRGVTDEREAAKKTSAELDGSSFVKRINRCVFWSGAAAKAFRRRKVVGGWKNCRQRLKGKEDQKEKLYRNRRDAPGKYKRPKKQAKSLLFGRHQIDTELALTVNRKRLTEKPLQSPRMSEERPTFASSSTAVWWALHINHSSNRYIAIQLSSGGWQLSDLFSPVLPSLPPSAAVACR